MLPIKDPNVRICPKMQLSGGKAPVSLIYGNPASAWSLNTASK